MTFRYSQPGSTERKSFDIEGLKSKHGDEQKQEAPWLICGVPL